MTGFDYAVLLIVAVSILLSVMRGVVREVLALLAWLVAFWIASVYAVAVTPYLPQALASPALRLLAAYIGVFLASLLLMSLLTIAVGELIKTLGLRGLDKSLGAIFGLLRGLLIVCVLVLVGGMTSLPRQDFWRDAMLSAPLEAVVISAKPWLPHDLAKHIHFD